MHLDLPKRPIIWNGGNSRWRAVQVELIRFVKTGPFFWRAAATSKAARTFFPLFQQKQGIWHECHGLYQSFPFEIDKQLGRAGAGGTGWLEIAKDRTNATTMHQFGFQLSSVHHPMRFQKLMLNEPLEASDVSTDRPSWLHSPWLVLSGRPRARFYKKKKDGSGELLVADWNEWYRC